MIIVCPHCSARIHIDDAKLPTGSFSVRCPKCNATANANGAATAPRNPLAGDTSAPTCQKFERLKPAPRFESHTGGHSDDPDHLSASELARALTELLGQRWNGNEKPGRERPSWNRRRVLICTPEGRREGTARLLDESGYDVFVAADTREAVERMRENQLDVVLLDPEFDLAEQGAAFVTREVNILRPTQRRRLFFGLLSPSLRTLDAHAAFLSNANLTVNPSELEELPSVLDRAIRDYNELYSDFFRALNLPAL